MKHSIFLVASLAFFLLCPYGWGKEYHVSPKGDDRNDGSAETPFRTIGEAARQAYPGDVITVHAGIYRERIDPPRGGESDAKRIVYRAAPGEKAEIKGSERITGWTEEKGCKGVWKVVLPNSFFGGYNPYSEPIRGDWFHGKGRVHHTGEVFLNGKSLYEKETLLKVLHPVADSTIDDPAGSLYAWYCENNGDSTAIWGNFHAFDPNRELVEISVRPTCFYPTEKGIDYITVSGFHFSQAATQWGAPTAEQIGMVATHWNKGWIIENNVIRDSKCSGITLGKERESGHNVWSADPGKDGSLHYIEVTFNAIRKGWNRENVGSHIVRNNVIFNCEQTGICGSMGASFSLIENNLIYDIWTKRQFDGAEIGGIKLHAAIDARIRNNCIRNAARGIWLDWMTQGTRVSANLLYDNDLQDLFLEVNHGPFLIDNNIFGSRCNLRDQSQGGAYVHNLFLGKLHHFPEYSRYTPYFLPHSTDIAGLSVIRGGDDRFFNNLFIPADTLTPKDIPGRFGTAAYDKTGYPVLTEGNLYGRNAVPLPGENVPAGLTDFPAEARLERKNGEIRLLLSLPEIIRDSLNTRQIDTRTLGKAELPRQPFEQPDGTPLAIDTDYFGNLRTDRPLPGPFESLRRGRNSITVWRETGNR